MSFAWLHAKTIATMSADDTKMPGIVKSRPYAGISVGGETGAKVNANPIAVLH
jgi:hypothetical protein